MSAEPPRMARADLELLADLIADRLRRGGVGGEAGAHPHAAGDGRDAQRQATDAAPVLVDAAAVANALSISRDSVYRHADLLGGRRLRDTPKARLRFDLDEAVGAWAARSSSEGPAAPESPAPAPVPARRTRRTSGTDPRALPARSVQPRPIQRGAPARLQPPGARQQRG
jgi:hypothetical protein